MATVNLRGSDWEILWRNPGKGNHGFCNYSKRKIYIRSKIPPVEELDTLIHEMLHACLPDMSEDTVLETATDIATALHALGWRKEE